jgi:MFS family permease
MTAVANAGPAASWRLRSSPWLVAGQGAAALAVSMGIGRFVYTPILPLMHAQAGLSSGAGAWLATANYAGYLAGALAAILVPSLVRSAAVMRTSIVVLIATLALMPVTRDDAAWLGLRLVAGVCTALVFVIAVSAVLSHLRGHGQHLTGWAFGGVGGGIALSGALVLVVRLASDWRAAWWAATAVALVLSAGALTLRPEPAHGPPAAAGSAAGGAAAGGTAAPRSHRWFWALLASYSLEGTGYIIAGTFLVAAIEQGTPGWAGTGAWVLVGLAALAAPAVWAWLGRRWSRPGLLVAALIIQAAGIALPAVVGGVAAALVSAFLFGATFLAIALMSLSIGAQLQFPRAVAVLTTGYSVGQIVGPLVVTPLIRHGYHQALLIAAVVVLAGAVAAGVLRIGFPRASSRSAVASGGGPGGAGRAG